MAFLNGWEFILKVVENRQWIENQFSECDLGDKRRTKRLEQVASHMLASPESSLPGQNPVWGDLKAAYRLFDNSLVTFDAVAEQHWKQTRQSKPGRYLLISDTTDINRYSHKATTGLGILGDGVGRGMQLHNCLMYDCNNRLIHGTAGALLYYRRRSPKNEKRMQRLARERESSVWGNLVDKVGAPPEGCQWIHVFDRGGDDFEAMCHIRLTGCDWVIRASKLKRKVLTEAAKQTALQEALHDARSLGTYDLNLRSRPGMAARTANMAISTLTVTFPRPTHHSKWVKVCGIEKLTMNVVVVQEVAAPKGATPIRWVLLTSLPANSFDDAWQVISDYENRWLVEEYHKVIKTACRVEVHALRTSERLEPLIGLISVIGIRLFQLKLVGRSQPEAKAATHVPSSWIKCLTLARPKLRITGMTVYEFFRELARLGGFLARTGDGEPGWQTVWRGYKKMQSLLDGLRLAGAI